MCGSNRNLKTVLAMQWIVIWGLSSLAASLLAALISYPKNRDHSYWMAWCFVVPPLVILLLILPKKQGQRPRQPTLDEIDRRSGNN